MLVIKEKIKSILGNVVVLLLKMNKLDNIIVFESSPDFSDNTKELFMYLINHGYNKKYKLVWFVEKKEKMDFTYNNVIFLEYYNKNIINLIMGWYYLSKSKYAFYSHRTPFIKPKKGQKFINLWHGSGLKNTGFIDMSKNFDYVLNTGKKFNAPFINLLGCKENQLLSFGNSRTDLFFVDNSHIRDYYIEDYKKIIIWMPTYRQHKNGGREHFLDLKNEVNKTGLPIIKTKEDYFRLNKVLEELNILLIIKPHPAQDLSKLNISPNDNIILVTNDDLQDKNHELYSFIAISDALITDYSSVYVDYLLMDKPIGFTLDDMNLYSSGYTFDNPLEYMPGEKINNINEFEKFLENCANGKDVYKNERREINNLLNDYHDGKVSKRIVDYLKI